MKRNPCPSGLRLFPFLLVTLLILPGCRSGAPQRAAENTGEVKTASATPAPAQPEAQIAINEALLKKPHAILSGSVQNTGRETLGRLSVVLELRSRDEDEVEEREVPVEPEDLAPGEQGKYALKVLSDDWSGSRVVRLRSGSRAQDVAFKAVPGARRPPERLEPRVTIVNESRTKPKSKGDDFINTPDNPISVP